LVSADEWNSLEWLGQAQSLLDWLINIDTGPVLLMVRHSERAEDIDVPTTIRAELTDLGHQIAIEFGRRIPEKWRVSIYHSPHSRTTQTSERISEGLQERGSVLVDTESLNVLLGGRGDIEQIITLAHQEGFDEFYNQWVQKQIPSDTLEPIDDYLQRLTEAIVTRFSKAGPCDLHLYVTHDIVIAAGRMTYLDLTIDDGIDIPFFGGFGIALIEGKLVGFNKGEQVKVTRNLFT
jgi:broad specificity phosphatase PhoE